MYTSTAWPHTNISIALRPLAVHVYSNTCHGYKTTRRIRIDCCVAMLNSLSHTNESICERTFASHCIYIANTAYAALRRYTQTNTRACVQFERQSCTVNAYRHLRFVAANAAADAAQNPPFKTLQVLSGQR